MAFTFDNLKAFIRTLVYGGMVTAANALVPRSGYTVRKDIAYGDGARQTLDIYVPDGLTAPAPVLLFFHGGSWQFGDKKQYRALGQAFASKGIVTVVVNYGLFPPARFPRFIEDGARSFQYVRGRAREWSGDPDRIFISGHSAGAHIAAMLGTNGEYLRAAGADPSAPRGIIGIAGPYDFLPLKDPVLIDLFGGGDVPETQPIAFVDGQRAPMLLAHGRDDATVGAGNSKRLAQKLQSFGSEVVVRYYHRTGHIGILLSLAPGFRKRTTLYQDMLAFIAKH
ncbi:MAG: alpha/beta hydrolase [Proteobacteria bacterium]|nr:alpha/beta hydrolase [Pseudomonadota bacterium]